MVRICLPHGGNLTIKSYDGNGSYNFTGFIQDREYAHFILNLFKPSNFTIEKTTTKCLKRLKANESDVSVAFHPLMESSYYYVPIVEWNIAPGILSGYEVNEYIRNKTSVDHFRDGLIQNLGAFDTWTYLTLFLFYFMLLLLKQIGKWILLLSARKISKKNKSKREWMIQRNLKLWQNKISRQRYSQFKLLLIFMSHLTFFFIVTPFLDLYTSLQVLLPKPYIITDYETIIRTNMRVYPKSTVANEFFRPSMTNVKNNDLTKKFYDHLVKNKNVSIYSLPDDSKSLTTYQKWAPLAKLIVEKYFVMIHKSHSLERMRLLMYAFSPKDKYYRMFVSKDASQREFLVGAAFRKGFIDPSLLKKLRTVDEMKDKFANFLTREDIDQVFRENRNVTCEHRYRQIKYCMDKTLEADQQDTTPSNNDQLIKLAAIVLACSYIVSLCIFII